MQTATLFASLKSSSPVDRTMGSRRFVTLILLSVLSGSACAARSQLVQDGTLQASTPHTVAGVVLNSVTDRPIPRALVQGGQYAMLTDSDGRFEFHDVTDNIFLMASRPGYFPEDAAPVQSPSIPRGSESVEIRLTPEAIVSGHVTDAQGNPIEGVSVTLRSLTISSGTRHWQPRVSTTTNAEGEFRVAELQAGEYAIQTALKLDGPPEGDAAAGYAPAVYPEIGPNGAGALQVRAGDQLQAEMSTRLEKLYPVSGIVTGLPANTWLTFTVRSDDGVELNVSARQYPETGEFHILLPSGSFELRALAYAQRPLRHSNVPQIISPPEQLVARHAVRVAQGPVTGLRMTLEPMATLPIEVEQQTTAKPQAAGAAFSPSQLNLSLLSADPDTPLAVYGAEHTSPPQQVPPDGPLIIRNLPPGRYLLQAQAPPPWHIASAVCGGVDLTRDPLAITGSAAGCTLQVAVRDDAASVKVSVAPAASDQPAPAFIYLLPLNNLARDAQTYSTANDGQASVEAVAPGQYLLLAMRRSGAQFAFRDAESLHRYEAEGTRVDLSPGENPDVHLDLISGEP